MNRVSVTYVPGDLSSEDGVREMVTAATEGGHIDILVNNAGIQHVAKVSFTHMRTHTYIHTHTHTLSLSLSISISFMRYDNIPDFCVFGYEKGGIICYGTMEQHLSSEPNCTFLGEQGIASRYV